MGYTVFRALCYAFENNEQLGVLRTLQDNDDIHVNLAAFVTKRSVNAIIKTLVSAASWNSSSWSIYR